MTTYYNDQLLIDIQARLDIVDLVSETVKLSRKGNRYWGLCPFHEEKTSSFSVTPEKNMFYCFGCHAGGDIFSFLMKRDGLEFKEAVEILAARAGVEIPRSGTKKGSDQRKKVIEVNQEAADFYHNVLFSRHGHPGIEYLKKRGISPRTVENYKIGYAPDKWNSLEAYLFKKGLPQEALKTSGLIKRSDNQDRYYDLFRRRIIFPIFHYNGDIVGFGGRVLDDGLPKYLNSPETEIFSKRRELYGLFQAREAIRQKNEAIIVEGYLDCLKLHQYDIKNTVATLGTALTREQAGLLRRYTEKVLIIYDSDEAGQRETMRAIDILAEEGLIVNAVTLPGAKDPDEYLDLCGKEEFLQYIQNNRVSHIEFKLNRHIQSDKVLNLEDKSRAIALVRNDIGRLNSELERDYYVKLLAQRLIIEENLVVKELDKQDGHKEGIKRNNSKIIRDNIKYCSYGLHEKILALMFSREEVFEKIKNSIGLEFFARQDYKLLVKNFEYMKSTGEYSWNKFVQWANQEGLGSSLARIMFLMEEENPIVDIEIEEFIHKVLNLKRKSRWQKLYSDLNRLDHEGDFNSWLGFLVELNHFLNHTREGGIK
ncbi:MAG: DNA primase [Syntrophomonas sp.]